LITVRGERLVEWYEEVSIEQKTTLKDYYVVSLAARWRRKYDTRGSSVAPYRDCRTSYLGNHVHTIESPELSCGYWMRFYKSSNRYDLADSRCVNRRQSVVDQGNCFTKLGAQELSINSLRKCFWGSPQPAFTRLSYAERGYSR
jgi:hypothetical protein